MAWQLQRAEGFESAFRRFDKKHSEEAKAILKNLDRYLESLQQGLNPLQIKTGFIHNEPKGVKAIDQSGCNNPNPTQARLYIYPEIDKNLLHIITIGTKQDQDADVNTSGSYVTRLRKGG